MAIIIVTQVRSLIHASRRQRRTMAALGLKRLRHSVQHKDTPTIRGMIATVKHLVHVHHSD